MEKEKESWKENKKEKSEWNLLSVFVKLEQGLFHK